MIEKAVKPPRLSWRIRLACHLLGRSSIQPYYVPVIASTLTALRQTQQFMVDNRNHFRHIPSVYNRLQTAVQTASNILSRADFHPTPKHRERIGLLQTELTNSTHIIHRGIQERNAERENFEERIRGLERELANATKEVERFRRKLGRAYEERG